jgi:hypothetical protein
MKKITIIALTLIVFSCSSKKQDVENVQKTFNSYKNAVLQKNGTDAIKFVDKTTIDYYAKMLDHAKNIKSNELQNLTLLDKLMILSLRHRATSTELNSFNDESLLIWAINSGMIGEESVKNATMGTIEIDGNNAKGQFINNGQSTPFYYKFVKSGETWKIDLTSMFSVSEKGLIQLARQQNMTHQEFIYYLLEMTTGKEVNPNIWYKMIE